MSARGFCFIAITLLMVLLTGCAGNSVQPAPPQPLPLELRAFPDDVNPSPAPDNIQRQLDLAQRNLYQTRDGHVRLLSAQACALDLVAHRGHVDYPENSLSGVKAAFAAGFPRVEVDIMRLRDGTWVLHHDAVTGRASGFASGVNSALSAMTAAGFSRLRLRDPKTLQLTTEYAPTLSALLDALAQLMQDHQRLQVEFKSPASAHELVTLDRMLSKTLGQRYEYVAQDIELLAQLRQLNPSVYLGVIEVPASTSIQELGRQQADARGIQPTRLSRRVEQKAQETYRKHRTNWLSATGMTKVQQRLGSNAGIHVDHASLTQQTGAVARAAQLNIPLYTYTVTGHAPHMASLAQLKAKRTLPSGAVVDDTHLNICSAFFNVIPPALPDSSPESFILRLPADADFAVLAEQQRLLSTGQYRNNRGAIVRMPARTNARTASQATPVLLNTDFRTVEDEALDLRRDRALRIYLHTKPAADKTTP